jgi:RsiW-degrading membrane proteinase PrsW (M82 family)
VTAAKVEGDPDVAVKPARLPATLFLVLGVTALVVTASAVLGPVSAPEFFMTYALIQAGVFLVLIRLTDLYQREPITVVGLMVLWGATISCLLAVPGNEFVNGLLSERTRLVFGPAITAPLVEEAAKGIALVIAFLLSQVAARRFGAHAFEGLSDGLVYGAAVGMGFAFTEDVFYFYGLANQAGVREGWELFQSRVDLFGLNMLGHSIYTGLFGAGLGAATVIVRRRRRVHAAVGGIGAIRRCGSA